MAPNLIDCVIHWKKKLDRNPDEDTILNVIRKLSKIPITQEILEATHIGKSIRNLSKRDDIVGENAKAVLNKWRNVFLNMEATKNFKEKSINSKDNVEKSSTKQYFIKVKPHHHDRKSSHELKEEKHSKNSLHHSSSKSNHSLDESEIKKSLLNDADFYHHIEAAVTSSPDSQDAFLLDDRKKVSSSSDAYAISSLKRKLTNEEKSEAHVNLHPKKIKSEKHSSCDSEGKKKSRILVDKDESFSENLKKEKNSSSHSKKAKHDNSKVKNVAESEKLKPKAKTQSSDGFTASSISFEDCLGFSDVATVKKKKSSKSQSSTKKLSSDSVQVKNGVTDIKAADNSSHKKAVDDKPNVSKKSPHSSKDKQPVNVPKKSTMFDASNANSSFLSPFQLNNLEKEKKTNEDVIKFTSSKKEKTAIYSGRKNCSRGIPSLAQCCYRVLIENIDILGPMGDTPYTLLKPVLEKCTPNQLFTIEKYNPHFLYDTNELWEIHCKRDYKLLSPLEHETWRDVYLRGFDEREEKLKHITANISASMLKATPVRQVKLAFIDSYVKPPRDVLRRQAKHRLLESSANIIKPVVSPKESHKKIASASCSKPSSESFVANKIDSVKTNESIPTETSNHLPSPKGNKKPVAPIVDPTVSDKDFNALMIAAKKPKVAPLMAKTLKTMKKCFRR